jgi:hypothetical protein
MWYKIEYQKDSYTTNFIAETSYWAEIKKEIKGFLCEKEFRSKFNINFCDLPKLEDKIPSLILITYKSKKIRTMISFKRYFFDLKPYKSNETGEEGWFTEFKNDIYIFDKKFNLINE